MNTHMNWKKPKANEQNSKSSSGQTDEFDQHLSKLVQDKKSKIQSQKLNPISNPPVPNSGSKGGNAGLDLHDNSPNQKNPWAGKKVPPIIGQGNGTLQYKESDNSSKPKPTSLPGLKKTAVSSRSHRLNQVFNDVVPEVSKEEEEDDDGERMKSDLKRSEGFAKKLRGSVADAPKWGAVDQQPDAMDLTFPGGERPKGAIRNIPRKRVARHAQEDSEAGIEQKGQEGNDPDDQPATRKLHASTKTWRLKRKPIAFNQHAPGQGKPGSFSAEIDENAVNADLGISPSEGSDAERESGIEGGETGARMAPKTKAIFRKARVIVKADGTYTLEEPDDNAGESKKEASDPSSSESSLQDTKLQRLNGLQGPKKISRRGLSTIGEAFELEEEDEPEEEEGEGNRQSMARLKNRVLSGEEISGAVNESERVVASAVLASIVKAKGIRRHAIQIRSQHVQELLAATLTHDPYGKWKDVLLGIGAVVLIAGSIAVLVLLGGGFIALDDVAGSVVEMVAEETRDRVLDAVEERAIALQRKQAESNAQYESVKDSLVKKKAVSRMIHPKGDGAEQTEVLALYQSWRAKMKPEMDRLEHAIREGEGTEADFEQWEKLQPSYYPNDTEYTKDHVRELNRLNKERKKWIPEVDRIEEALRTGDATEADFEQWEKIYPTLEPARKKYTVEYMRKQNQLNKQLAIHMPEITRLEEAINTGAGTEDDFEKWEQICKTYSPNDPEGTKDFAREVNREAKTYAKHEPEWKRLQALLKKGQLQGPELERWAAIRQEIWPDLSNDSLAEGRALNEEYAERYRNFLEFEQEAKRLVETKEEKKKKVAGKMAPENAQTQEDSYQEYLKVQDLLALKLQKQADEAARQAAKKKKLKTSTKEEEKGP